MNIFEKWIPIFVSLSLHRFLKFDGMATEKFRDKIYLPFVETDETTSGYLWKEEFLFLLSFLYF